MYLDTIILIFVAYYLNFCYHRVDIITWSPLYLNILCTRLVYLAISVVLTAVWARPLLTRALVACETFADYSSVQVICLFTLSVRTMLKESSKRRPLS